MSVRSSASNVDLPLFPEAWGKVRGGKCRRGYAAYPRRW